MIRVVQRQIYLAPPPPLSWLVVDSFWSSEQGERGTKISIAVVTRYLGKGLLFQNSGWVHQLLTIMEILILLSNIHLWLIK